MCLSAWHTLELYLLKKEKTRREIDVILTWDLSYIGYIGYNFV